MFNKIAIVGTVASLALFSITGQAGAMGDVVDHPHKLFVSLDAAYDWPDSGHFSTTYSTNGLVANLGPVSRSADGWGTRLAAGAMLPSVITLPVLHKNIPLTYTAEIGYGWYGVERYRTNYNFTAPGTTDRVQGTSKADLGFWGMDLLVGAMHRYKSIDIVGKIGAMVQNTGYILKLGNPTQKTVFDSVMPEVSGGLIYNLTPELGVDLTYFYVFGGHPSASYDYTDLSTSQGELKTSLIPPALSVLQFGLRYQFA